MFMQRGSDRTWTKASRQLTDRLEVRRVLSEAIDELRWSPVPVQVPEGIHQAVGAIKEAYDVPDLTAVAWTGPELQPCCLLGLEARYLEGSVRHYWLDTGEEYLPLATDLWPAQ